MIPAIPSIIAGIATPLSKIENEFQRIWQQTNENSTEISTVKASTLNLIILCGNRERFKKLVQIIPEITKNNPGRIIMALVDQQDGSKDIRSYISAFCQPPREDRTRICCELITLETGKNGVQHLSGTLLPLLLPDLPVFLYHHNNFMLNDPQLAYLGSNVERTILDTPAAFPSLDDVHRFTENVLKTSTQNKTSDIQWSRLTYWRETIAELYDGKDGSNHLAALSHITIRYAGAGYATKALFLAGWLASRLQWQAEKYSDNKNLEIQFTNSMHKTVQITLQPVTNTPIPDGNIVEIELKTKEYMHPGWSLQADGGSIQLYKMNSNEKLGKNTCSPHSNTWLIGSELDYVRNDTIYLAAIHLLWNVMNMDKRNNHEIY